MPETVIEMLSKKGGRSAKIKKTEKFRNKNIKIKFSVVSFFRILKFTIFAERKSFTSIHQSIKPLKFIKSLSADMLFSHLNCN